MVVVPSKDRKDPVLTLCGGCAPGVIDNLHLGRAAAAGLAAGAAAAVLWFAAVAGTGYQLGPIAVVVGAAVGQAILWAAGGRRGLARGPRVQALSAGIALAAMVVAEYLITWHAANQYLAGEGRAALELLQPIDVMARFVVIPLKDDPFSLVFWAIAIWAAYRVPRGRLRVWRTTL